MIEKQLTDFERLGAMLFQIAADNRQVFTTYASGRSHTIGAQSRSSNWTEFKPVQFLFNSQGTLTGILVHD